MERQAVICSLELLFVSGFLSEGHLALRLRRTLSAPLRSSRRSVIEGEKIERSKDMAIKKFSSAYYVVGNMDQAVAFYTDTLGMNVKFRDGNRWTQFDVNGVGVALADPSEGAVPPGGGATVVLEVDNFAEMREKLVQSGAPVNAIVDMGGHGKYFTTKDPAGNIVQIFARS